MPEIQLSKVRSSEAELQYTEVGRGVPVVFVHGGFADYRLWAKPCSVLAKKYRTVAYSRRGYHPNRRPRKSATPVAVHSADLLALVSQVSDAPAHLVGESYGAYAALRFALDHPERVRSLSIDEPPIPGLLHKDAAPLDEVEAFQAMLTGALQDFAADRPARAAESVIDYLEGTRGVYGSLPREIKGAIQANSQATYDDLRGGLDGVSLDELRRLQTPTLVMKSDSGPKMLKLVVDLLAEELPDASLKEIPGSTHGTIVDTEGYSDAVGAFLARN